MKFSRFCCYLEILEKTSARLEITRVIGEMIDEMGADEVREGVYLMLGNMGPSFDNKEFGMAVKMVVRAMAMASGVSIGELEMRYKKLGDVGELANDLEIDSVGGEAEMLVIYQKLNEVANDSGTGSQERKVRELSQLLLSMSGIERRYVVRMVLGKLRLGFSEKTIFDALSTLKKGNKSVRKMIDSVYQIYPDHGMIVKTIKEKGLEGLGEIRVQAGVPVVPALCQRLDEYEEIINKMKEVAIERKYDGTRIQIHFNRLKNEVKTFTRNLEENTYMFPELVGIEKWVRADSAIFDCEAVGYDRESNKILPFQVTITRKRKHGVGEKALEVPLRFFLFDILSKDGQDLLNKPYYERRKILADTVVENEVMEVDEYVQVSSPEKIMELHNQYLAEGYEGAVMKVWNGPYLPGRQGWNWVKIKEVEGTKGKLLDTIDAVVMGYYRGRGKRATFGIGAFLVGIKKDGKWLSLAKIGTGLSDEEFVSLREKLDNLTESRQPSDYEVVPSLAPDVWVRPEIVVEIAADEITKSPLHAGGIALRFPRLIRFRNDKGSNQSTSWDELLTIGKVG